MKNRQNTQEKRDAAMELNSTIAYHLSLRVPSLAPDQSPVSADTRARNNNAYAEGAEDLTLHGELSPSDTDTALYDLLMHYVNLLEAPEHGGWTLEEENSVRAAITALVHSGWKAPPLHDMHEENLTTHFLEALLAKVKQL